MANAIEVENVRKRFGDFVAVNGISFSVEQGQIFAFLGPNGAGKTTTIKMLTTVLAPSEGRLLIAGHDPVKEPLRARSAFGIVFQDPSLDDELTAAENMELHGVLYGVRRAERRLRTESLLRLVDLWDRRGDYVKRFSGGMKRRLEIARALQHRPRILFLDEPTVGLDPQTRNQIWEFIRALSRNEGVTVFFTTHYMEEAERITSALIRAVSRSAFSSRRPADITSAPVIRRAPYSVCGLVRRQSPARRDCHRSQPLDQYQFTTSRPTSCSCFARTGEARTGLGATCRASSVPWRRKPPAGERP